MACYLRTLKAVKCLRIVDFRCASSYFARNARYYSRWVRRLPRSVLSNDVDRVSRDDVKRFVETESLNTAQTTTLNEMLSDGETSLKIKEVFKSNFLETETVSRSVSMLQEEIKSISNPSRTKDSCQFEKIKSNTDIFSVNRPVGERTVKSALKLGVPVFAKLEDRDSKLSNIMVTIKSTKKKKSREMILLEGRRLIQDCVDAGVIPSFIFFSRTSDLKQLHLPASGIEIYKVSYKTLSLWSELSTCPGIMGIVRLPEVHEVKTPPDCLPLTVICDNIRDPSNLGAILRTAAGVGCQKVILTKGCVDVWDSKVLRSATGAHFRVRIHNSMSWDEIHKLLGEDYSVFLADNKLEGSSVKLNKDNSAAPSDTQEICDDTVESVPDSTVLPVIPYHIVNFTTKSSIVLVIGGETEGLSPGAYTLAHEKQGLRINIPLSNNIDSLNTGTALGVISFEVRRQLCKDRSIEASCGPELVNS